MVFAIALHYIKNEEGRVEFRGKNEKIRWSCDDRIFFEISKRERVRRNILDAGLSDDIGHGIKKDDCDESNF